jgi:hypothetical protein
VGLADADADCQSFIDGVGWDVIEVAAVELRPTEGAEDIVELVSRRLLYPIGGGDSGRVR